MTLEDLRKEFEAARDELSHAFDDIMPYDNKILSITADDFANEWEPFPNDVGPDGRTETILAARRYIIARAFNVFDPDQADMLWKLQQA